MNSKECFIKKIDNLLNDCPDIFGQDEEAEKALSFYHELKSGKKNSTKEMTENGCKILKFMQENIEAYNNVFKAKEIAEGLFMPPRSVSGSMRKLVSDGYADKLGQDPVCYSLTDKGLEKELPVVDGN